MRLLGEALRNLNTESGMGWTWVTQEQMQRCGARDEDCEGLVNYVLSIGEVEVAALLRELPDGRFRVSLRSKGNLDVAHVAESFEGGGHECASGCSVEGPLAEALRQILGSLRNGSSVQ
jgi:phosphoesterase RecJ-like protein